ncbi:MAG TPA: hypothetical protein VLA44_06365 [Clostridia bacterium]|nr:hypothetical protein [Clostridia bacterium]
MNDEQLIRSLRALDAPATPDPRFSQELLTRLRAERRRGRRVRLGLLAAAALLVVGAGAGMLLAGSRSSERSAVVPPPVPSPAPALPSDPTVGPPGLEPDAELPVEAAMKAESLTGASTSGGFAMVGTPDAVWFGATDSFGANPVVGRLDAGTRTVSQVSLAWRAGPAVGPDHAWAVVDEGGRQVLVAIDPPGTSRITRIPLELDASAVSLAAEQDDLWLGFEGGIGRLDATGGAGVLNERAGLLSSIQLPFEARPDLGYDARFEPAPMFGSLWAYDSATATVYRLDPGDGTLQARIELGDCPPRAPHRNYPGHNPVVYPVEGADGFPDGLAVSCPMDGETHEHPGPLHLIDAASNEVITLDVGSRYGPGVVVGRRWWIPISVADDNGPGAGLLARVDPVSRSIDRTLGLPPGMGWDPNGRLVLAGDSIWATLISRPEGILVLPIRFDELPG